MDHPRLWCLNWYSSDRALTLYISDIGLGRWAIIIHETQGRMQDFLIGGEPNNLGYRGRGTNERSEYKSAVTPPRFFLGEFRTPESESERNLTNYFIIFLLLFY